MLIKKSMKKLLFIIIISFISQYSFSQKVGFEFGYNFAKLSEQENKEGISTFQIGIMADLMKQENYFHVNTGLKFNQKGYNNIPKGLTNSKIRINYLEIPINFGLYLMNKGNNSSFFLQLGPYLAFSLMKAYSNDYGLNGGIGVDTRHMKITIAYSRGFNEVEYERENRVFSAIITIFL